MGAADKLNVDGIPRTLSNTGPGAAYLTLGRAAVPVGAVYAAEAASATDLVFDPSTYTVGVSPDEITIGPFVWGVYQDDGSLFRFDVIRSVFDVIPLNGVSPSAFVSSGPSMGGVAVDADGNGWAIETTSNTLVKINGEQPYIAATFPIPNSPKNLLAYDPVHDAIILLNANGADGTQPLARFDIAAKTFSADVLVGTSGEQVGAAIFVAGGFVFVGSGVIGGGGNVSHVYKVDPVSLATVSSASITPTDQGTPLAYAYLPNGGTPKLFVTLSENDQLFRINVTSMTVDVSYTQGGAAFLGLAINPLDNTLWVTDEDAAPSVIYQLSSITSSITLSNTFTVSNTANATTTSIVWDSVDDQMVVSSDALDEIYGMDPSDGSLTFQADVAGGLFAIQPGTVGQVLQSQGAGAIPAWASVAGGSAALDGVTYVTHSSSSPTLSATLQCASCDTDSGGSLPTINFPTSPTPGLMVSVFDSDANASVNNIHLDGGSNYIQSPYDNGVGTTLTLNTDNVAVLWVFDSSYGGGWQVVSAYLLVDYSTLAGLGTNTFTGAGTIAEVIPTETKLAFNTSYEVDSFAGETTTNATSSFTTIATIAVPTGGGIIDAALSVVGWDTGGSGSTIGAYRADLTFTAFWDGAAVILMQPLSPANPLNVRTNGGGSAYNSQVVVSGSNVLVQVEGQGVSPPTPINWSCIGQIQTRS